MAKTRTSKPTVSNVSVEEANEAAKNYGTAANKLSAIEAKMNARIDKIKQEYQDEITDLRIKQDNAVPILEQYAKQERENWINKSMELLQVVIGFRKATPSVAKTKFTWEAILELIQKNKHLKHFVRTKLELNKALILECDDAKTLSRLENEAYLVIEQKESFFVDIKKEDLKAD